MKSLRRVWRFSAALCVLFAIPLSALPSDRLSPSEQRGKQIYTEGVSPSGGQIVALLGEAGTEVPATVLPCANCHGRDGRGRPEGGVTPTDIRWETLTKPYGAHLESGREHPPYELHDLKRAIGMGFDSAGNHLHWAMPRYRMSLADMDDLLAFCQRLGGESDPGVATDVLRIGTLLPPEGPLAGIGDVIECTLSAAFEDWNRAGGIHGRRLELVTLRLPRDPGEASGKIGLFLTEERVFALCGPFAAGLEEEIATAAQEREVPVVGPLTLNPRLEPPLNRQVFYTLPGLVTQGRALVEFISARLGSRRPPVAIVHPDAAAFEEVASAIRTQAETRGWTNVSPISYSPLSWNAEELAERLARESVEVVFFLDNGQRATDLLSQADRIGWRPWTLLPGSLAGDAILDSPTRFEDRIFLSLPTLPSDLPRPRSGANQIPECRVGHRPTELTTQASAAILAEALKRAGRELSREGLVEKLEGLQEFDAGLTPLISFGPNRRVGARGAFVALVDLENRTIEPTGRWIEVPSASQ